MGASPGIRAPETVDASERRRFFGWIAVATALPFVVLGLDNHGLPDARWPDALSPALLFAGAGGHVAASFFFYGEPRIRSMMALQKARYAIVPALLVAGTALLFALADSVIKAHFLVVYWVWQTHHFTRQNQGVLAFAARERGASPCTEERTAIALTGLAAILAMIGFVTPYRQTALAPFEWHLHVTGLGIYLAAWAFYAAALFRSEVRSRPIRLGVGVLLMLFYAPLFLTDNATSAVFMYLIAHGLQYLVFMGYVAATPRERRLRSLGALAAWLLVGGAAIRWMQQGVSWPADGTALFGLSLGIVMWHFVLDAGIWRLSEPLQRRYMAERFRFLRAGTPGLASDAAPGS